MMNFASIAELLWGQRARFSYLFFAATILLFTFLGGREIWTQEHRWADIVSGMFFRHDFFHPYLGEAKYYDKPLLSYWLIVALAKITGVLSVWTLRFPSALSGLLAVWSIYWLGSKVRDKQLGLLSGWMLVTTFYFLFWGRTSSADMLNMAGSLFAVSWYYAKREEGGFFNYAIFFVILAVTALCKGLVGAVVPMIAVFANLCVEKSWKKHISWQLILATLPALVIYVSPFLASSYFSTETYDQNGLYLVYRENILRYFQPFDHKGPLYTYFLFLPVYLMPWAVFFIPALFSLPKRWKLLSDHSKWIAWTLLLLFIFFTASGSRRSYYVLPIVPFAILFTADWILTASESIRRLWTAGLVVVSSLLLFLAVDILPTLYYSQVGVDRFAVLLKEEASKIQPWEKWNVVMLDGEAKLNFYLQLPPNTKNYSINSKLRSSLSIETIMQKWPVLEQKADNTIYITRKLYVPVLQNTFRNYRMVELPSHNAFSFMKKQEIDTPVAFVPIK